MTFAEFSYSDKEYFFTKEFKSFDEAFAICKNRNESIVRIESKEENDFISDTILVPTGWWVWLSATNVGATKTFRWVDGGEIVYSNWYPRYPDKDPNQRNAIIVGGDKYHPGPGGDWVDVPTTGTYHVLCEKLLNGYALKSNLIEQAYQCNATITQLERKLKDQASDLSFELELHKRQSNLAIRSLQNDAKESKKYIGQLQNQAKDDSRVYEENIASLSKQINLNKHQNEMLIKQNDLLEMRLNRIEQKLSKGNSNTRFIGTSSNVWDNK